MIYACIVAWHQGLQHQVGHTSSSTSFIWQTQLVTPIVPTSTNCETQGKDESATLGWYIWGHCFQKKKLRTLIRAFITMIAALEYLSLKENSPRFLASNISLIYCVHSWKDSCSMENDSRCHRSITQSRTTENRALISFTSLDHSSSL